MLVSNGSSRIVTSQSAPLPVWNVSATGRFRLAASLCYPAGAGDWRAFVRSLTKQDSAHEVELRRSGLSVASPDRASERDVADRYRCWHERFRRGPGYTPHSPLWIWPPHFRDAPSFKENPQRK